MMSLHDIARVILPYRGYEVVVDGVQSDNV